jgi:UDP-N-acetylglucosamine 2-epimerase (non-hydrolysing)
MQPDQGLADLASRPLVSVSKVLQEVQPDVVLVQGDTTTVMMSAPAAFYQRIPVGHLEAGLHTRHRYNPFPEEINRRVTGVLATYHFAPTKWALAALRVEQVPEDNIFIIGNTLVDALLMTVQRPVDLELDSIPDGRQLILVTAHRPSSP